MPLHRHLSPRLSLLGLALAGYVQAAPLSFGAALELAQRNAPQLAAQSANVTAARAAAIPAGELPDPKLFVGVDNLPVSGMDRWRLNRDFMTMQKIGVMQEVPNAAKRQARNEVAEAVIARGEAERKLVRLTVRRETALAWLNRYYLERKQTLFDELDQQNRLLAEAVRAQLGGGKGSAADVVLPRQEASMLAERRDELVRDLAVSQSALRRWLGTAGDEPLQGEPPIYHIDDTHLQHRLDQHPELALFGPMAAMARAEVKEAEAGRRPDWGVEFAYQRRAPQYGDMVSVQLSFDLPIFQSTRQSPQIAAKQAELARIDAEREAMLREHRQALEADLADYARLDRAVDRQSKERVPQAQEKAELQLAGYRAGKVTLTELIAARRELVEARLRQIDLDSQRAQLAARLHFALGEDEQ